MLEPDDVLPDFFTLLDNRFTVGAEGDDACPHLVYLDGKPEIEGVLFSEKGDGVALGVTALVHHHGKDSPGLEQVAD